MKNIIGADKPNPPPEVQFLVVDEESDGQRLDNWLMRHLKGAPKTLVYRIIRSGEVRVNKALLSFGRQRYWELDRDLLADGLGNTSVHLQIVDVKSEKRTPLDEDQVDVAVAKARLAVPQPDRFRAYVRLRT